MQHPIRQGDIPGVQLRRDLELPVPASQVWPWLVEPALSARWLAGSVDLAGEELRLESRLPDGSALVERGRTIVHEEGRLWVLAFDRLDDDWEMATELRFELIGTEPAVLSVLQRGFERLSLSRCLSVWELYRSRWTAALDRLGEALRAPSA